VYTTAADVSALWRAFFDGQIVPRDWVTEMVRPRSATPDARRRYGLGFWLAAEGDAVSLTGADAGVSFRSVHDPARGLTHTMISNTTDAWQISRRLASSV
jgi:CubicO group peptidase (beta-lactamase class C family)